MILGIGIDIVKVDRFKKWSGYSYDRLRRVFSKQELVDCRVGEAYELLGLASRFAAKEAFFKALSAALVKLGMTKNEFSLLFLCKLVEVVKGEWGVPMLSVQWDEIESVTGKLPSISVEISISHEKEFAVAQALLHKEVFR